MSCQVVKDLQEIDDLVGNISPYDSLEKEHIENALRWIRSGAELYRRVKPATPPKHLVSYCTIVDPEKQSVLLVDHHKSGLWLPAGGHVDPDEHPQKTAFRELEEELGVLLPLLLETPAFITVTETVGPTAGHTDVTLWYVFVADPNVKFTYDQTEFKKVEWFSMDRLPLERTDPNLSRFCRKLRIHE